MHVKLYDTERNALACVSHRHSSRSFDYNYAHSESSKLETTSISKQTLRMLLAYDMKVHFVNKPARRYKHLLRDDPIQDTEAAQHDF